jgi:hypothetical protein
VGDGQGLAGETKDSLLVAGAVPNAGGHSAHRPRNKSSATHK